MRGLYECALEIESTDPSTVPEKNGLPRELVALLDSPAGPAREDAWQAFVRRYSRILLHAVHSHAQDYDGAMDRYAFVLEELRKGDFARLRRFAGDGRSRLSTWLVVVAQRLCNDYRRRRYGRLRAGDGPQGRKARARHDLRRRLVDMAASEFNIALVPDGSGRHNPELALRRRELENALRDAVAVLGPKDQLIVKLRFYEEMSAKEISEFMGLPSQSHARRRLRGALDEIRKSLEASGVADPKP